MAKKKKKKRHDSHPRSLKEVELLQHSGTRTDRMLSKVLGYDADLVRTMRIFMESRKGFRVLNSLGDRDSATFFGSNRSYLPPRIYEEATKLAGLLSKDGLAIVTGGGRGIMEAANKGAYEAGGPSVGFNIELPNVQHENPYITHGMLFKYFFIRKFLLSFSAEAYIFFPGGFGTMDEFFELMTLIQTRKIRKPVAVVVFGKDYWTPLIRFIHKTLYTENKTIDEKDQYIFHLFDDADEAHEYIMGYLKNHPHSRN